jgi:hypothetical protein
MQNHPTDTKAIEGKEQTAESTHSEPATSARPVRRIGLILTGILLAILSMGNDQSQAIGVSLFVVVFWGLVACGFGWCLPGNRMKHAKTGFDSGVLIITALLLYGRFVPSPQSVSASDTEQLRSAAKTFMAEAMPSVNQFNAQMSAIWGNGILQPKNLDTKEKIDSARSMVAQSQKLCAEYEQKICHQIEAWPEYLQALPIDSSAKSSLVAACRIKVTSVLATEHAMFDTHRQFHATVIDELNFLESRLGHFEVKNGIILFENETDLEKYNSEIQMIQRLAEKIQQLRSELASPADSKEFKEFLNG